MKISSILLITMKNENLHYLILSNVLYTSNLRINLLSIDKLIDKSCNVIFFYCEYTTIFDVSNNWFKIVVKKDGIYCLAIKDFPQATHTRRITVLLKLTLMSTSSCKLLSIQLWH